MAIKNNILINVLTRTSNRPIGFYKCYMSIKEQSYKHVRHIVSYDDKADLRYLSGLDVDKIYVGERHYYEQIDKVDVNGNAKAIYNLYCNDLLDEVKEGWIMFLDDDDNLFHNKVLEEIMKLIEKKGNNKDVIFIWQIRYPSGKKLPTNEMINAHVVKKNYVGSPCFLFHSKYKDKVRWDPFKASDYRFLEKLLNVIPKKVFLRKVGVQINNFGDLGRRNDIKSKAIEFYNLPFIFYKSFLWHFIPKYHVKIFGELLFHKRTYVEFIKKVNSKIKF